MMQLRYATLPKVKQYGKNGAKTLKEFSDQLIKGEVHIVKGKYGAQNWEGLLPTSGSGVPYHVLLFLQPAKHIETAGFARLLIHLDKARLQSTS